MKTCWRRALRLMTSERPHVVLIDCHDLGNRLGCYGDTYTRTPHLDALAQRGARFDNLFATAPVCMPSRISLYSGLYPHSAGMNGNEPPAEDVRCIGRLLGGAGYATALLGDFKLLASAEWGGYDHKLDEAGLAQQVRRLTEHGQPLFLHASFFLTHRPFGADYNEALARQLELPPTVPDLGAVRQDLAAFYGRVADLDDRVGEVLSALREAGLEENSLVLFTTDHGPAFPRAKHTLYDSGLRCALLMSHPAAIARGTRHDALISNVDVLPTLLELLSLPAPPNLQGRSFAPLLRREAYEPRDDVVSVFTWHGKANGTFWYYSPRRALRTERYKLIRNFTERPNFVNPGWLTRLGGERPLAEDWYGAPSPPWELYDCHTDPWELHNLAGSPHHQERQDDLSQRLHAALRALDDPILAGPVANIRHSPDAPQWWPDGSGRYRLRGFEPTEDDERPFPDLGTPLESRMKDEAPHG